MFKPTYSAVGATIGKQHDNLNIFDYTCGPSVRSVFPEPSLAHQNHCKPKFPVSAVTNEEIREMKNHWDYVSRGWVKRKLQQKVIAEESDAWKQEFRGLLGDKKQKVLDIGTGAGDIAILMAELGHNVSGVDISMKMLEGAEKRAKAKGLSINFQQGHAADLPFEDSAFDVVIMKHVFWALPNPVESIWEWIRVTAPEGKIIIIDAPRRGYVDRIVFNMVIFFYHAMIRRLRSNPTIDYSVSLRRKMPYLNGTTSSEMKRILSKFPVKQITTKNLENIFRIVTKYSETKIKLYRTITQWPKDMAAICVVSNKTAKSPRPSAQSTQNL